MCSRSRSRCCQAAGVRRWARRITRRVTGRAAVQEAATAQGLAVAFERKPPKRSVGLPSAARMSYASAAPAWVAGVGCTVMRPWAGSWEARSAAVKARLSWRSVMTVTGSRTRSKRINVRAAV